MEGEGVWAAVGRAGAVGDATRAVVGGTGVVLDGGVVPDGCWAGGMLFVMVWNSRIVSGVSFLPKFFLPQRRAVLDAASKASLVILWLLRYPSISEILAW